MAHTKRTTHTTRSLSRRAALVQTTIIAVVILVFSLAIVSFNTYRLHSQLESRVDNIARLAETSLTSAVWQVDHASARDFIEAVLQDDSVAFAQLVTGREVLASRNRMEYASKPFSYFKENKRFIARTVEIRKFGDWIGTFNFAVSTSPIREEVLINAGVTLLLAIVLILTISQTTLYFSRKRIFAPLKQLEESATAVADGDLDAFVNTSLPGELGNLARAFDDMRESVRHLIGDLQTANTKLKNHRNDLEETVRQRTDELRHKNDTLNQALEDVRAAQKSAEVANLAKSRFLASMSHEIRTPMNAILGMADILWETDLSDAQSRYVQVFKSAGESLLEILNDILDLSKIEAGHLELEQTGFSLAETVDKACSVIEPRTQDKELEFSCNIAADVPDWLEGDPNRLRQILLNLLGNAVKFTKTVPSTFCGARSQPNRRDYRTVFGIRHRPRHSHKQTRLDLRFLYAGRQFHHAGIRWNRSWFGHQQAARSDDGRQDLGGEFSRNGQHLPLYGHILLARHHPAIRGRNTGRS